MNTLRWDPSNRSERVEALRRVARRELARVERRQRARDLVELGYVDLGGEG